MYSGLELGFFIQYWKKILNLESVPLLCALRAMAPFAASWRSKNFSAGSHPWLLSNLGAVDPESWFRSLQACSNNSFSMTRRMRMFRWARGSDQRARDTHADPTHPLAWLCLLAGLPLCLWTGLCIIGLILVVPWDKGGNSLPQSMQRNPGTELCLSPEQGEDSQLTKQMLPSLPPV